MASHHNLVITLDIDWAPDFVIDSVAERLVSAGIHATWFVTHASEAVIRLSGHPELFELGIHPNFLPGSTHGNTADDVIRHCLNIVPDAVSMRTHALVQSTPLLVRVMEHASIQCDLSLFLPRASQCEPVEFWYDKKRLLRIPYVWEDDFEMHHPQPCWNAGAFFRPSANAVVVDFHPIHVYLNSPDMVSYERLKRRVSNLTEATVADVEDLIWRGKGTRTFFEELLATASPSRSCRAIDLARGWTNQTHLARAGAA